MDSNSIIKKSGRRLTGPRKDIFLALSNTPLTIQEISNNLKARNVKHDTATLYRTLELFVDLGLVNKVSLSDKLSRYELASQKHHHHLVCEGCGVIQDVTVNDETIVDEVAQKSTFLVKRHSLEFFGFCVNCQ